MVFIKREMDGLWFRKEFPLLTQHKAFFPLRHSTSLAPFLVELFPLPLGPRYVLKGDIRSILLAMGYFLNNEHTNFGKQTIKVCGPSRKQTSHQFQVFNRSKNNFGKIHISQRIDYLRFSLYPFILF